MKRIGTTNAGVLLEMREGEWQLFLKLARVVQGMGYVGLYESSHRMDEKMFYEGVEFEGTLSAIADWMTVKSIANDLHIIANRIEGSIKVKPDEPR